MDVADERQSQSFAPAARVLYRDRQGDAFGEDRARRLSVSPGNVQPAVKPHVVIGEHLASDFAEGARDVAPRLRWVVRPARRDSVADVGGLNLRRAGVGLKSEACAFRDHGADQSVVGVCEDERVVRRKSQ